MSKKALLITSVDDENLLLNNTQAKKIVLDYSFFLKNNIHENNDDFQYFFNSIPDNIADIPAKISRSWYRDINYKDNHQNLYSIGMILEKRICFMISNTLMFYFALSNIISKFDSITIPKNYPKYLDKVFRLFLPNIEFINNNSDYSGDLKTMMEKKSAVIKKIKINKFSKIMRIIQRPFLSLLYNKTLIFPDWTYSNEKNKNYLYQNKLNIFKSFYYEDVCVNNSLNIKNKPQINLNNIEKILDNHQVPQNDKKQIILLVKEIIANEYSESCQIVEQQYQVMKELISYYKPKKIVIPDTGVAPLYNMVMQISSRENIPTVSVLDGYTAYLDVSQITIKEDGVTPLVDYYATMGSTSDTLTKNLYPKFKTIMIKTPLLSHFSNNIKSLKKYAVMIMMPIPNAISTECRWDKRNKYVLDIIKYLESTDQVSCKIAIKVKPGANLNDIELLADIINRYNNLSNSNIDYEFIYGPIYKILNNVSMVIGQLGTTTYESLVSDIPYYIYEPVEFGLTDTIVKNSIVKMSYVSRNIEKLAENINNKNNVKIAKDGLIDGNYMSMVIN
jgi:hypothetical protein